MEHLPILDLIFDVLSSFEDSQQTHLVISLLGNITAACEKPYIENLVKNGLID
jgi:predicted transcriptional regulator